MSWCGEKQGLRDHGKLLYNKIHCIGPTGTAVFFDKYKIDDMSVMGEAEITLTYVSQPQSHTRSTADTVMWKGIYVY